MVTINGTDLYVETFGPSEAPPLLFIHGHGAGSYHFTHYQAERLSQDVRLILVDQRGVLRSTPLAPGDELDEAQLIADYEALREHLGIDQWAILGSSAGGHYGLRYAVEHPASISAVAFDCPLWDFDLSDRYRLPMFAELYDQSGETEKADRCRELAALSCRITPDDRTWELAFGLGDRFEAMFWYDVNLGAEFRRVGEDAGFPPEYWERGLSHGALMPDLYTDVTPLLGLLRQPSLLIHGIKDFAVSPPGIEAFRNDVKNGREICFERSGHFPHAEEPDRYAELVRSLVLGATP